MVKRKSVVTLLLGAVLVLATCLRVNAEQAVADSESGSVGLRPLPRSAADLKTDHGGSWAGMPTFDAQKGNYPFVAEHLDVVMGWLGGDFVTKRMFFEYYWGLSEARDDPDPRKNNLIKEIRRWESRGAMVEHILICREARLAVNRGWPDAELGPFKEDGRILSAGDVGEIRGIFREAHGLGLVKHENYKLIQMVEEPSFFAEDSEARAVVAKMEGIAYEAHQFNRHWPLETGWSRPDKVVKGAKWTLAQGKEYIFYYGPVIWKSKHYHEFIERDWLKTYWAAGLPKHHLRMHYYLNTFPHGSGRGRPVGPESDPHSVLGFTKWLIEEIKMGAPVASVAAAANALKLDENEDVIRVSLRGKPVLEYVKTEKPVPEGIAPAYRRSGYLHPVFSPGGRELTGDFPPDHPHQHGLFMAWTRTSFDGARVDFWNLVKEEGRVEHRAVIAREEKEGSVSFTVKLAHVAGTGEKRKDVLHETWKVTIHLTPDDHFLFDIESVQKCATDKALILPEYKYGGMAFRGNTEWVKEQGDHSINPGDLRFLTSEGKDRWGANHTRPHWVAMTGVLDGQESAIAIMGSPKNFRAPQPVRIHPAKPYFCFAPMVTGEFKIEPGKNYVSRYRYLVTAAAADRDFIETQWKVYAKEGK